MNFIDRARQLFGLQKSVNGGSAIQRATFPVNGFQQGLNFPTAQGGGSVVEACVAAYAQTVAQLPGRHYELDENGTKTYVMGSRLARVLAKPNEFQTRSDFMLNLVYSLLHEGNAYWVGNAVGNERPNAIYLLDPKTTQAHRVRETGDIFYSSSGAFLDMVDVVIDGRAMIPERYVGHARLHTPHDPLIGVTPLRNAAASVAANEALVGAQAAFFNNMSRPSGIISTELDLTAEQMSQLREAWEVQSKNLNAGGVPILGGGMKWQPLTMNSNDAQLVEAWRMTIEDISRVFRVPPMLINNMENATFQNAETLMRFWLSSGLGFLINHIELAMSAFYDLDDRKEGVELDQDVLLSADLQAQMEALGTGVTKGLLAPNEGRAKIGYGPVTGGDMPRVQAQMVPLDAPVQQEASSGPVAPVDGPVAPVDGPVDQGGDEEPVDEDKAVATMLGPKRNDLAEEVQTMKIEEGISRAA